MGHKFILLCGMPRSGTTWLGKIFDSHPDTLYRHEPDSRGRLNDIPLLPPAEEFRRWEGELNTFVALLNHFGDIKVAASMPIFPKHYYTPVTFQLRRALVTVAKVASQFLGEFRIPNLIDFQRHPQLVSVWKSIESTGRLGVIARLFEEARIVHIVRHPCGYVASVLRGESRAKFADTLPTSEDYGLFEMLLDTPQAYRYNLSLETLRQLTPVERLAWRWVLFNEKALDDSQGLNNCMSIRYEDVCQEPEERVRELFEFCDLGWNIQTSRFLTQSTSTEQATYYSVFKNPMAAAYRWRDELSPDEVGRILAVVQKTAIGRLYPEPD